jgi:hypothetical protein
VGVDAGRRGDSRPYDRGGADDRHVAVQPGTTEITPPNKPEVLAGGETGQHENCRGYR